MVQENAHAHGASRAVLSSILSMTTSSNKPSRVIAITLEPSLIQDGNIHHKKLTVLDFTSDWAVVEASFSDDPQQQPSPLLTLIQERLETTLAHTTTSHQSASARPTVVAVDSLNVLLEMYNMQRVLQWLRQLRRDRRIGSVVFRLNASALLSPAAPTVTVQSLAHEATAVVQVETHTSLQAYPILAKERRRQIPKRMQGLVLLLRKKKNGRTSESVEYFQVVDGSVVYSSCDHDEVQSTTTTSSSSTTAPTTPSAPAVASKKALPVRADEMSFNLSISEEEATAKSKVELPYMHQGSSAAATTNNLIFIDDDDPDWDDDDLDDDLDI